MVALTILGMDYILVFAGPVLWRGKHRELGFDAVVLMISSDLIVEGLKLLFDRQRPMAILSEVHTLNWGPFTDATSLSFPSGHASRAFATATLIALGTRRYVGVSVLSLAVLIGLSRIYLGLHWPSDVLAGALLGVLMAFIMRSVGKRDNAYTRTRNRAVRMLRNLKHDDEHTGHST
jgi:membrane-associated phospholipid phosphatase